MIELNENITSVIVTEVFSYVGLAEAIINRHCDTGMVPMRKRESHPIYGIYITQSLFIYHTRAIYHLELSYQITASSG